MKITGKDLLDKLSEVGLWACDEKNELDYESAQILLALTGLVIFAYEGNTIDLINFIRKYAEEKGADQFMKNTGRNN